MNRNNKGQFVKGFKPWNKNVKGIHLSPQTEFKKGDNAVLLEQRFWEKVNKTNTCWMWIGYKDVNGYGKVMIGRKSSLAHRVSYELVVAKIPKGMHACHKCDNPSCVNPEHIFIGTAKDNLQDMSKKGRWGNQYYKNK